MPNLSNFLLAVTATAFRGEGTESADAAKRVERDFGVRADRTFWARYLTQPVPKFPLAHEPYGSFRLPQTLLAEFRDVCAKHTFLSHRCAGFSATDPRERPLGYLNEQGDMQPLRHLPLIGATAVGMDRVKSDPVRTMELGISKIAASIGRSFDYGFLRGVGPSQPLGIVDSPATIAVERQPKLWDNVASMRSRFASEVTGDHLWIGSDSVTFWGIKPEIHGPAPLKWTDMLPTLLQRGCLLLIDPSRYAAVIRWESLEIAAAITEGSEVCFMFWINGDGAPLVLARNESGGSPFVALGASA